MSQQIESNSIGEIAELIATDPGLALEVIAALPHAVRSSPELRLLAAEAHAAEGHWQQVLDALDGALTGGPEDSDVHHLLGIAYGELGDSAQARHHFLRTRELDERSDSEVELTEEIADAIATEAKRVLDDLPAEFRERLGNVLVVLETRPSEELVAEGFDPRAYGLFEGLDHAEQLNQAPSDQVTRIVLFAANLLADFPEPDVLAEEIRVTVLHEVGHYFGLDEDDMARLGLD